VAFGLTLDPPEAYTVTGRTELNLNGGPIRVDQAGIDWGDAAIQAFMAQQGRYGAAPVDYVIPNRTISIPLAVFTDELSGTTYDQAKRMLSAKIGMIQREGGVLKRSTDTGAYSPVYADIVDATINFPDVWGDSGEIEVNVHVTLTALPDFYGSEIVLDSMTSQSSTDDIKGVLLKNGAVAPILGDWPGRCRITISDTSGNDQRSAMGGFRSRFYQGDSMSSLGYEANALTPTTGATTTSLTGATNGSALRITSLPPQIWTPVFTTDIATPAPNLLPQPLISADISNWSASSPAYWVNTGGRIYPRTLGDPTVSYPVAKQFIGVASAEITTDAVSAFEGAVYTFSQTFTSGQPYTFSVYMRGAVGGEQVQMNFGARSADNAGVNVTLTTAWTRYSVTWTPTTNETTVDIVMRTPSALAQRWYANGAQVETGSSASAFVGGGPASHRGNYRVIARVYTTVGDNPSGAVPPVWLRFSWAVGQTIYQTINDQLELQTANQFWLADLGQISLQPAPSGVHYWRGTLQVYAPPGGSARDIWVDRIWYVPLDESSWKPTAPMAVAQGVNPLAAWDDFASLGSGAALNARNPPLGPAWQTSGATATGTNTTDLTGTGTGGVKRSTVGDVFASPLAQGRLAINGTGVAGNGVFTDTEVGGDWMCTNFNPHTNWALQPGVIARYTDNNNYLWFGYAWQSATGPYMRLMVVAAGGTAVIGTVKIIELPNTWVSIDLRVLSNGQAFGSVALQGQNRNPLWKCSGYHAALATGGTLASGRAGFQDSSVGGPASTRTYDNVFARNPVVSTRDAVMFGNHSAELRSDGMFRYDQNGVVQTPITRREGDLPRLPTSGNENRPVEMLLVTSRSDLDSIPDQGIDGFTAQIRYRPCWLLGQ